jgi:hydroxymethylbilane synthase
MRLGTRASALALAQAELVAQRLQGAGQDDVEIVAIVTRGDRESAGVDDTAGQLAGDGAPGEPPPGEDKSRWVSELEHALLDGRIDAAVHSAKDVPGELADGLVLAAAPPRAGAEDVLCGAASLDSLAPGARIGTSSVRRIAQLHAARDDVEVVATHGNVDTRLRKLAERELDALVLARAGLQRLRRDDEIGAVLDCERFVPAPGQGTLALQARADDTTTLGALRAAGDDQALACLLCERALSRALNAGCDTPLGAHASLHAGAMRLRAWVGLTDGSAWILDERTGDPGEGGELARQMAERLRLAGADAILSAAAQAPAR